MRKVLVGIDPDRGIAVGVGREIIEAVTVSGVEAMKARLALIYASYDVVCVVVERVSNRHIYKRAGANTAAMMRIAYNVGENQRKAEEIIRWCENRGLVYRMTPVRWRGKTVTKGSKQEHEKFCRITKWPAKKKLSSHARDAVMLVWDSNPNLIRQYAEMGV